VKAQKEAAAASEATPAATPETAPSQ
jgi:hypothetical protein